MTSLRSILGILSLVGALCGFYLFGLSSIANGHHPTPDAYGNQTWTIFSSFSLRSFWLLQAIMYAIYALVVRLMPSPYWDRFQPMGCFLLSITLSVNGTICGVSFWLGGTLPCVEWLLTTAFNLALCGIFAFGCVDRLTGDDNDGDDEENSSNDIDGGSDEYINVNDLTEPLMVHIV